MTAPPAITPIEFAPEDFEAAERIAEALGYHQTVYTSTSALWGLFCLKENPRTVRHTKHTQHLPPYAAGCIIKTREFGLLFVADCEDLNLRPDARRHGHPTPASCGAQHADDTGKYRCTRPAGHAGDHVMTTHPLHPTWRDR